MKFLVIGASGQVGNSLFKILRHKANPSDISCLGTSSSFVSDEFTKLDISDFRAVKTVVLDYDPDIIFVPAAVTNVDYCQKNPNETYRVNTLGPKNVVDVAGGRQVVFFSSDFIFDGQEGYYREDDIPNPINMYGYQKLLAEHYIVTNAVGYKIIRTNVVYGPELQGKNFVTRLVENLRKGNEATIPTDEYGTPTYGPDLAKYAIDLALSPHPNGIYHASGSTLVNRYKFALEAARVFECDERLVKPILSADLKRAAKRPLNAGLQSRKVSLIPQPSGYSEGLRKMKATYESI